MTKFNKGFIFILSGVVLCTFLLSGCEPLRKKFTRKKKEERKEEFVPVLDPVHYPASRVSALEKYEYHFSMWQVWSKDLRQLVNQATMDKRKKYLAAQLIQQLEEMKRWIPKENLHQLEEVIDDYQKVAKELEKPEIMRSDTLIESRLRRLESHVRNELDPDLIFEETAKEG